MIEDRPFAEPTERTILQIRCQRQVAGRRSLTSKCGSVMRPDSFPERVKPGCTFGTGKQKRGE
eukprot:611452-Alexandrium_andersonii.AAC.1